MGQTINQGRRTFLKAGAAAGGGLLIGFYLPGAGRLAQAAEADTEFRPNAWIRLDPDGWVTVIVDKSEMGQGVLTAMPMLVADEMDAAWNRVRVQNAPVAKAYVNPLLGMQATGGSTSVRASWEPLRKAGAAAREMLVAAAAKKWGVQPDQCRAAEGAVIHLASGRRLGYGDLAAAAAELPLPQQVFLKDPKAFTLIGRPVPRLDTPQKVNGSARFGLDVRIPGMLTAVVVRCPVFGGKAAAFDEKPAKAIEGVRHVLRIDSGIAVVADGFWAADRGAKALRVRWDEGPNAALSSAEIRRQFVALAQKPGAVARNTGDATQALAGAARTIEAVYEVPFLAHAAMEPMNCTVHVRPDGCDVWAPTQAQGRAQQTVAKLTGLAPETINIHTTFLGGGFGRRFEQDFVAEAAQIGKALGVPVKVVWTREDDTRHDFYRPATYNVLTAALDDKGLPLAWRHRIVGPSIMSRVFPDMVKNGIDRTSVEGAANLPYAIPNLRVEYAMHNTAVPVGFWRSVGSSQNGFITECFLDELAAAGGKDPFQLRRELLRNAPRHKAVLELAADKAGWGKPLPRGWYRGIAVHESFTSYVAQVAHVSVSKQGEVQVHRVVCAVDCGPVVNPDTVRAQMESAIVYGLTAALKGEITVRDGRVQQSNFNDYPLLRIDEMPRVEVYIRPGADHPGGVGEPGTPPIAPAVVNAVFAATGKRIRRLPIRAEELKA